MKKSMLSLVLIAAVSLAFANPPVNEKVLKQFSAVFPSVTDARWFENEGHYDVYFEKEETRYHIRYNREGKIISTRNYYPGTRLCTFLQARVAEQFPGKNIFGVTEITNSNEMFYVIILEDDKTWTNVRSDATGRLDVMEKMTKSE